MTERLSVTTEQLRRYFRENYLDFIDRKLTIRVISIYHKNPNGQPIEGMSPAASLARAKEIRAEIAEGLSFADAAARYAQDKELQKTGGLVGSKLTMDSRIFRSCRTPDGFQSRKGRYCRAGKDRVRCASCEGRER
ncbi:MAG: peptidylprolyl isomerase [Planctomycetota bacterium]|nr:peptidylprolyl isomerase [Planctomycetota bacterium]